MIRPRCRWTDLIDAEPLVYLLELGHHVDHPGMHVDVERLVTSSLSRGNR